MSTPRAFAFWRIAAQGPLTSVLRLTPPRRALGRRLVAGRMQETCGPRLGLGPAHCSCCISVMNHSMARQLAE